MNVRSIPKVAISSAVTVLRWPLEQGQRVLHGDPGAASEGGSAPSAGRGRLRAAGSRRAGAPPSHAPIARGGREATGRGETPGVRRGARRVAGRRLVPVGTAQPATGRARPAARRANLAGADARVEAVDVLMDSAQGGRGRQPELEELPEVEPRQLDEVELDELGGDEAELALGGDEAELALDEDEAELALDEDEAELALGGDEAELALDEDAQPEAEQNGARTARATRAKTQPQSQAPQSRESGETQADETPREPEAALAVTIDRLEGLERLADLRDREILTDEEVAEAKSSLLHQQ